MHPASSASNHVKQDRCLDKNHQSQCGHDGQTKVYDDINDEANDDNLGEEISCDDWAVKIISNLHKFEQNKVIGCQFFNQMVVLDNKLRV